MRRLARVLRDRGGVTLVELLAASTLLVLLITMCAAAVPPAARVMTRLRTLNYAQVILDDVLETVRSELEGAQSYVKFYADGGNIAGRTGSSSGEAVEFLGENGFLILLTAGGCEETDLCRRAQGDGGAVRYDRFDTEDAVPPGRLLLRYYLPDGETYVYRQDDRPIARALTTVYPGAFYMGLWLDLEFRPDSGTGTGTVTVAASLYRDEDRTDLVCSDSLIADLRFAGKNGLKVRYDVTALAVS